MDAAHIAACSFEAWYPRFEHVTFRSAVLPLPPGFEDFLVQDGVFLPSSSAAVRHACWVHSMQSASSGVQVILFDKQHVSTADLQNAALLASIAARFARSCRQTPRAQPPCPSVAQMPRRSKPDEYAVEGVDYTEWSSSDDDADSGIEAAVGLDQVQSRVFHVYKATAHLVPTCEVRLPRAVGAM